MAESAKQKVKEFQAVGIAKIPGKSGFVITRFTISGDRVLNAELVTPEAAPEPKPFAARRMIAAAQKLMEEISRE